MFAPGHFGELTQHLPFGMVDEALAATDTTQSRLRDLPSRVVIYLLLAGDRWHPDAGTAVKKILGSVTPVAIGVAELRNRGYGTGHGAGG